jgi:hypothetical protein
MSTVNEIWNEALEVAAAIVDPIDSPDELEREAYDVAKLIRAQKRFPSGDGEVASNADPIDVFYSLENDGAGACSIYFFLSEEKARKSQDEHNSEDHPWGEDCSGRLPTYVGSTVYASAVRNENGDDAEGW